MAFLILLGLLDLISAVFIFLSLSRSQALLGFVLILGIIMLLKGIWSLAVHSFFAGFTDTISGILLLLISAKIYLPDIIIWIFGILILIKAMQSIIFYMIRGA